MRQQYQRSLFIFRRDLRLQDNTALIDALEQSKEVLVCFFLDPRLLEVSKPHFNAIQFMIEALQDLETQLLPYIDLILYDLKLYDLHKHKQYTGGSNKTILSNLADLVRESRVTIIPRLPLVPKITATTDNLAQIARFLRSSGIATCELLPYNPGGITKRIVLGKDIPPDISHTMMGTKEEKRWRETISNYW